MQENNSITNQSSSSDIRRVFFLIIKYWYFILFSVAISLTLAYLINRYAVRIYPVSMTILLKDQNEQDNTISDLLYNSRGFLPGKNYYNQEILLRSYPLIRSAIEDLNFGVAFYQEGDIKTSEIYPGPPLNIEIDSASSSPPFGQSFYIIFKEGNALGIEPTIEDGLAVTSEFNEWFDYDGTRFRITKKSMIDFSQYSKLRVTFTSKASIASSYTSRLRVSWLQEGASILSLTLNGPTPKKEADFLLKLAETYQNLDLVTKNEQATRTVNFIDDQLTIISDSLVNLEIEIQKFKESNFAAGVSNEASRYQDNLDKLVDRQSQLVLEENYYEYLSNYLSSENDFREITVPASIGISNDLLNQLIRNLIEIQIEKNQLLKSSNSENPYLAELDSRIFEIRSSILEVLNSLKNSMEIAKNELGRQTSLVKGGLSALPKVEREYINLNRLYKLSESLFLILMEKKAEASITQAANTSDVVIVNPPIIGGAITPKTNKNYFIALLLGLGIPVGLIMLFDYFNDKVKFKEDVEKYTDIPFLGVIGHNKNDANLIVDKYPRSAITESFRSIRSNINFFIGEKSEKTILITSSIAGEGKTFCADNLAMIFALTGKRTVLIGADMRRPKIFRDFKLSNDLGLSNYLSSDLELDEVIQKSPFENLFILNSGTIPPNPSELLLKEKLSALMASLKAKFDFVIIDSPPVGLVTDAMILSKYADHSIYIVRQGYTPVGTVKNADEMYRAGKLSNLSILFNDVMVNKYGYGYGYSYKYGYTYGHGSGYYSNERGAKSVLGFFKSSKKK